MESSDRSRPRSELASPPRAQDVASDDSGVETADAGRQRDGDVPWDLLGLARPRLGLLGLRRSSDNDGYTDDPI